MKKNSNMYKSPCWKCGMCVSDPLNELHVPLHRQILQEIRTTLKSTFGETAGKEILLSGDTLVQICWKAAGPNDVDVAQSSSSSGASSSRDSSSFVQGKFFLLVPWLCLCCICIFFFWRVISLLLLTGTTKLFALPLPPLPCGWTNHSGKGCPPATIRSAFAT